MNDLNDKIRLLPKDPGVYVMLDKEKNVIYVGKAKNLKNRVTQYFRNGYKTEKVAAMVMNIVDFYYVIAPSEADALVLENTLIKKYKPKYNILLKDDKSYPYIRVDLKEKYPAFTVARKLKKDGAKYFGPYMLGVSVQDALSIIKDAYGVRPCFKKFKEGKLYKECLNYHIGLCPAPCAEKCTEEEYLKRVKRAIDFLSGNDDDTEELLKNKMLAAAEREDFERAAQYRDRLKTLNFVKQKRITELSRFISADVIAADSDGIFAAINVLFIRNGKMMGAENFAAESLSDNEGAKIEEFINRFYSEKREIPPEIIIGSDEVDAELLSEYLTGLNGKTVSVVIVKQGVKRRLYDMAKKNATEYLSRQIDRIRHKDDMTKLACQRLKEVLGLKNYPRRIECYDISHISGVDKVGSMTVFIDGAPSKTDYRRFKIKTVEGNNDFACMNEVLLRRLKKLGTDEEERFPRPDLVVIDGGKGQLSAVKDLFGEYSPETDLISLAKREEEIFTVASNVPVVLNHSDYALKVLQRIRDEAHRFAITFNRDLRKKRTLKSLLTEIDGIGSKKRDALIDKFKDINGIMSASIDELSETEGIGKTLAENIKEYFRNGSI